jgi:hypothetical protein
MLGTSLCNENRKLQWKNTERTWAVSPAVPSACTFKMDFNNGSVNTLWQRICATIEKLWRQYFLWGSCRGYIRRPALKHLVSI